MKLNKTFQVLLMLGVTSALNAQEMGIIPIEPVSDKKISQATPVNIPVNNVNGQQGRARMDYASTPSQLVNDVNNMEYGADDISADYDRVFSQRNSQQQSLLDKVKDRYEPTQRYEVEPKDNILIPVGIGLLNSISTNFNMVAAKTSDKDTVIDIEGGYLYPTLISDAPVGLILYEEGVPESQISITLVPIDSPPAMIDIKVNMTPQMKKSAEQYADMLDKEESMQQMNEGLEQYASEHQKRLVQHLMPVAKGDMPQGFALSSDIPASYKTPCNIAIYHETKQRLIGGNHYIDVVLVHNDSNQSYTVREEMCASRDALAAAVFDKSYLQPGQKTEMYIVRDRYYERDVIKSNRRPKLY